MKNEKLKKETVASEFDELTDEQLEKVLGGLEESSKLKKSPVQAGGETLHVSTDDE